MAIAPTINDIREITPILSEKFKIDFSNYAFSFLRRRFAHVFNVLNIKSIYDFIEGIQNGMFIEEFSYHFPVSDTEMFRDPSFWRFLRVKVLPTIDHDKLSFWFPDLVSNEELFSLLIILKEEKIVKQSKVYCNEYSLRKIEEIKSGIIDAKKVEINRQNFKRLELNSNFEDYFLYENGVMRIDESLLSNVQFIKDNYFCQVPEKEMSFVFFRNRMIYYNSKMQINAEQKLHKSIKKGGYLAIGIKEKISQLNDNLFDGYNESEKIFKV